MSVSGKRLLNLLIGASLLLAGVVGFVWLARAPRLPGERMRQPLPALTLRDATGAAVDTATLRGRPLLLNFWATWCPPCDEEMPDLETLYRQEDATGVLVLAVNLQETPAQVAAYAAQRGFNLPLWLDEKGELAKQLDVTYLPTTFFVDAEGIIRSRVRRALTLEEMQQAAAVLGR